MAIGQAKKDYVIKHMSMLREKSTAIAFSKFHFQ